MKQGTTFEGTAIVYCWPKEEVDCKSRPCVNSCCDYLDVIDDKRETCRSHVSSKNNNSFIISDTDTSFTLSVEQRIPLCVERGTL